MCEAKGPTRMGEGVETARAVRADDRTNKASRNDAIDPLYRVPYTYVRGLGGFTSNVKESGISSPLEWNVLIQRIFSIKGVVSFTDGRKK